MSRPQLPGRDAWMAAAVVLLGAACWVAGCSEGEEQRPQPPVDEAAPAESDPGLAPRWSAPPSQQGAESCVECHDNIVASWSRTGMARALSAIDADEFAGLGEVADAPSGMVYAFEADQRGARVVERCPEVPEHRLEAELLYAIGAGDLDRAFAARRGAFEWFAPLEILSTPRGRHAALAPGHMSAPNQRFTVSITPECLGCHTDQLPPRAFPLNLHQGDAWQPRGISCAACHGDVEQHARLQRAAGEHEFATGDPILRPQELSREQRMSVCAACHLQGDVRIGLEPRVLGIPAPGGDLLEQRALFVAAHPSDEIGFVSQTERLVLSRCYQDSRTMSCETCHDPHRTIRDPTERQRVRGACALCHPAGMQPPSHEKHDRGPACSRPASLVPSSTQDCAACHMRFTRVFDVAEVQIHDHFIRKHPGPASPPSRPRISESPQGDWKRFAWPGAAAPEHVDDAGLWMMAYSHRGHLERALAHVDTPPHPLVDSLPMYHHARGSLLERSGRARDALSAYERALTLDPDLSPSAINLGQLLGQFDQGELGVALLDGVLARHPEAVGALRNRAGLRYEQHDSAGFEADLLRAFELQPSAQLAKLLSDWFLFRRDPASAATWQRRTAQEDPLGSLSPSSPGAPGD